MLTNARLRTLPRWQVYVRMGGRIRRNTHCPFSPGITVRNHRSTHKRINLIELCEKSGPGTLTRIDGDFFLSIRQCFVARVICGGTASMGGLPLLGRSLHQPRHLVPAPFRAGSIEAVAPDKLQAFRGNMLSEVDEEVQGIEQVDVLLEILRVFGVKQNLPFERLVTYFLLRRRRPSSVLGATLPALGVGEANRVVEAEL